MTRSKRLEPVQHLIDDTARRLQQSLAGFEKRVLENEKKLEDLERYRTEYGTQFTQRAGKGMGATDLRDYQAFLARLNEAIRQQQTLVERARIERDAEFERWQAAAIKAKALDHVVDRWQAEERREEDRKEQRETDERGQRKPVEE
jgi:flagellar FliJ protein